MMTLYDRDAMVYREIHTMVASGWRVHRRWSGGADFMSGGSGSGISAGVHMILILLTFGLWLPVMVIVEMSSSGGIKFCRLTFDDRGRPRYESIKRPNR